MSSDLEVIKAIIDAFDRSDWSEIDVSSGSLRIHLSTTSPAADGAAAPVNAAPPAAASGTDPNGDGVTSGPSDSGTTNAAAIPAGTHVVLSPSPGIFWRSPHPGSPPFADIGDEVQPGSTLAIVEVMKLMNHISAGIPGTVVAVLVDNGVRVDRGTALFAVRPSASP